MASIILPVIALTGVIRKLSDITGNLILDEVSAGYWLREDMVWIEREMRRIESYLVDVDAIVSTQGESQRLLNFISDITELAEYVEKTIIVYGNMSEKRKRFSGCFVTCTWSHHQLLMKIKKIRRRVTEITDAKSRYGIPDNPDKAKSDHVDRRRSYSHFEEPNVVGLDEQVDMLVSRLKNSESQGCIISIVGMPGVGKTTLAKKVYNSAKDFMCSAWVHVSQNPSILELMKDVARQVGLVKEQWEGNLIEENLYSFLKGKRYVIFLDDIWDTNTWDDNLRKCFPASDEGRNIVLTSRYSSVGRGIGGESSLHELQPLDSNSSWELFSTLIMAHEVNNSMNIPSELEDVGRLITEKCGGVPLAIVTAAGMLRRKERRPDVWSRVLNNMDRDQECSNSLALSYKDLPLHLKPCFLYFGCFPKGHEIPTFKIMNQWVAEGFIRPDGIQAVEDMGEDYLEELIARNLIVVVRRKFNGRVKNCRIHDLLHNICISEATRSKLFDTSHRKTDHMFANCKISAKRAVLQFLGDQKLESEHFKSIVENSYSLKYCV